MSTLSITDLLAKGYFPKELPPGFTTNSLASYVSSVGVSGLANPTKRVTMPGVHILSRSGHYRRILQLPNPANHVKLCDTITQHWAALGAHYSKSTSSLSVPVPDPTAQRALRTSTDGNNLNYARAKNRSTSLFVLRADISRYYASIYTHSVPWALLTKPVAKQQRNVTHLLGNILDKLLRDAQDQQTLGIPIGPDTSLVIAEIIGCEIDHMMQAEGLSGIRYMDDIEIVVDSRSAAEQALSKIEEILARFELALNSRKTFIEELPTRVNSLWVDEIKGESLLPIIHFATSSAVLRYFDKVFGLRSQFPGEPVLTYALAYLEGVTVADRAWDTFQELVFQCVNVEPLAMRSAIALLQEANTVGGKSISSGLDTVIYKIIERHGGIVQGSDVAWALWAAIVFGVKIPDTLAARLAVEPDSIVAVIALHARAMGLIDSKVQFPHWVACLASDGLYGREWLLAYEADLQGWLTSPSMANFVDNDAFFGPLKCNGVSFYDPTAYKVQVKPPQGKPNY